MSWMLLAGTLQFCCLPEACFVHFGERQYRACRRSILSYKGAHVVDELLILMACVADLSHLTSWADDVGGKRGGGVNTLPSSGLGNN